MAWVSAQSAFEERVPAKHPLPKLRGMVDALLATMNTDFEALYARRVRHSVPPEMLLKALLMQILSSIRSERQLVDAIDYNLVRMGAIGGWWDAHHKFVPEFMRQKWAKRLELGPRGGPQRLIRAQESSDFAPNQNGECLGNHFSIGLLTNV